MKRVFAAVASAAVLVAMLPALASAGRVIKFTDHHVGVFCESPVDGGFLIANVDSSTAFGTFAAFDLWLDPAIPFEDPSSMLGFTETVDIVEGATDIVVTVSFVATDYDGNELGEANLVATMVPFGEPSGPDPVLKGNHKSKTQRVSQPIEGTAVLTVPGGAFEVPCFGDVTDIDAFENSPTSFVFQNDGVALDCFWETEDAAAGLFVVKDGFGFFADAFLFTADMEAFTSSQSTGSIDAASMSASMTLRDELSGDPLSAQASADFEPAGGPVTSTLIQQNGRTRLVEQALSADGSIEFSTGDAFLIDDEHCDAVAFERRGAFSAPHGPKPGAAPVNDTPDGAIALRVGSRLNTQTTGAVFDPEVPNTTCPEGDFDAMGHTVWYTVQGTGGPITIDTSGSGFDTVVAVYVRESGEFVEVGCDDDVAFEPVGSSLQTVLTVDTNPGETYYIQVGGYRRFFSDTAESGRLRLAIR